MYEGTSAGLDKPVITRECGIPIYRQISLHYQTAIMQGHLSAGSLLPTERELAQKLGVNRSTVSTAYAELKSTGLIETTQGSGTTVTQNLWDVAPTLNWNHFVNPSFSPSRPVLTQVREASARPEVIDLATGQLAPSLVPTKTLEKLLSRIRLSDRLDYPDAKGLHALRESLVVHLAECYGIQARSDEILITSGAQLAFMLLTQCMFSSGDAVAIECPSYIYSLKFFTAAGVRMLGLPVDRNGIDPDDVVRLYERQRIRAVFTNATFQNPTGTTLSLTRRKRLLEVCYRHGVPIVEVDFVNPLAFADSPPPPPALKALDEHGIVIHVGSFSDTLAPGVRMGWVVASKPLLRRLEDVKHQMDLGSSVIPQLLTHLYLSEGHWAQHVQHLRHQLMNRRDRMVQALHEYTGGLLEVSVPHGGLDMWCKLTAPVQDRVLVEELTKCGVIVSPGSIYGVESGFIRVSFSKCKFDEIDDGIRRLAECLKSLN